MSTWRTFRTRHVGSSWYLPGAALAPDRPKPPDIVRGQPLGKARRASRTHAPLIAVTNVVPVRGDWHESGPDREVIGTNGASDHLNGARV